jgi:hypothetical protein
MGPPPKWALLLGVILLYGCATAVAVDASNLGGGSHQR